MNMHQRITRMYEHYNPSKVRNVDRILKLYSGNEDDLLQELIAKYGPEPDTECMTLKDRITSMYEHYNPSKLRCVGRLLILYEGSHDKLLQELVDRYGPEPEDTDESCECESNATMSDAEAGYDGDLVSIPSSAVPELNSTEPLSDAVQEHHVVANHATEPPPPPQLQMHKAVPSPDAQRVVMSPHGSDLPPRRIVRGGIRLRGISKESFDEQPHARREMFLSAFEKDLTSHLRFGPDNHVRAVDVVAPGFTVRVDFDVSGSVNVLSMSEGLARSVQGGCVALTATRACFGHSLGGDPYGLIVEASMVAGGSATSNFDVLSSSPPHRSVHDAHHYSGSVGGDGASRSSKAMASSSFASLKSISDSIGKVQAQRVSHPISSIGYRALDDLL
eukprot:PhM_4_TR15638/c0_g1_i8/m.64575